MMPLSRRDFLQTGAGGLLWALFAQPSTFFPRSTAPRLRMALVGTGIRGLGMWGRPVARDYARTVEIVGLCDINPGRLAFGKEYIGSDCPIFTDFDQMVLETGPDVVIVTTVDSTHDVFIVGAMEMGCDVITEKPITTDERKAQAIIDAQQRTGHDVIVTHNLRYAPIDVRMKELLVEERIGRVTSADLHWYLDVYHGAEYFRRWHGKERYSGTLYVHKASHHFDLLNWWLNSEPEEVYGTAALEYYGHNNDFRSTKCRGCPHQDDCSYYWDITENDFLMDLYVANEHHDGYIRDGCVWDPDIDIFDKMAAQITYANGVHVSYSCTTYSPYEGYRIALNGTEGRLEMWVQLRQPWDVPDHTTIRLTDNFGATQLIDIPDVGGGHGGADVRLRDRTFNVGGSDSDPLNQSADLRQGIMAVLVGIAARNSVRSGRPEKIARLTSYNPRSTLSG